MSDDKISTRAAAILAEAAEDLRNAIVRMEHVSVALSKMEHEIPITTTEGSALARCSRQNWLRLMANGGAKPVTMPRQTASHMWSTADVRFVMGLEVDGRRPFD